MKTLSKYFEFKDRKTDLRTELLAGLTTFLTMSYIIFVNPGILSAAGVPFNAAATATAISAGIMCIAMGFFTNRPLAMASGMGINAAVAFSIIGFAQSNVSWQVGMAVVFVEGLIILLLVLSGLREAVMNAIPINLKRAIGVGIGLFISVIGLSQGGIIRPAPVTLVALGDFSQSYVWVTLVGLFSIIIFMSRKVKGDLLWGMLTASVFALILGLVKLPTAVVAELDFSAFGAPFQRLPNGSLPIFELLSPALLVAVFALMLTDFFDTMGTVFAVGEQAGFLSSNGRVPGIKKILIVDSIAASVGGLFGASSVTTYVESTAGVAQGGRTGLTAIVTGFLFIIAAFFAPLIHMVGGGCSIPNASHYALMGNSGFIVPGGNYFVYPITAGALIIVGFLMIKIVREMHWDKFEDAFPAFLTLIGIPLTYNISYGIGFGFISYTLIKVFNGKFREVHTIMYVVSLAFAIMFASVWV
jgi:adenine/guanine/hypoxanthine permease